MRDNGSAIIPKRSLIPALITGKNECFNYQLKDQGRYHGGTYPRILRMCRSYL